MIIMRIKVTLTSLSKQYTFLKLHYRHLDDIYNWRDDNETILYNGY